MWKGDNKIMKVIVCCPDCKCEDLKFSSDVSEYIYKCTKCNKEFYIHSPAVVTKENGEVSDGYHTFDELYYHRMRLFAVICNSYRDLAWKSWKHHDGSMYPDYFIVGITSPRGQYSYHYHKSHWDEFKVTVLDSAPVWDGHSPADIIRLNSIISEPISRVTNGYDRGALYLFRDGYDFSVGYIDKINEKSITMSNGRRIPKKDFDLTHKLTPIEEALYRGELLKRICDHRPAIDSMRLHLKNLNSALRLSPLVAVDCEKLQETIDSLNEVLTLGLNQVIEINGKSLRLCSWGRHLEEVSTNECK